MAETLTLIDPQKLQRNPDNPRLIFREDELLALEESIAAQGILVPLTIYRNGNKFFILDGERRWRCALKLGLSRVPVILQPKPDHMQNIMMMFAIHNARRDWDPLPTALKLQELEDLFEKRQRRKPKEKELAELASMPVGQVRRLKKLLELPAKYRTALLDELEKPKSRQQITVDHVLEATTGAAALRKNHIIGEKDEDRLREAILSKFRKGVIKNTVAPRKLVKLARAVQRGDIPTRQAAAIATRLIEHAEFTIDDAFTQSVEQAELEHNLEMQVNRVDKSLKDYLESDRLISPQLRESLSTLGRTIRRALKTNE